MSNTRSGGCACGTIRYRVEGEPLTSVYCYCTDCQRRSNSDRTFSAWVPSAAFKVTQGSPAVFARRSDSGAEMTHHFCARCGINLFVTSDAFAVVPVCINTLDPPHGLTAKMAIFTGSAPEWALFAEALPRFERMPPKK